MSRPVHILGIGADGIEGLSHRARAALAEATFIAGGTRHLDLVGPRGVETFAITNNLSALAERLKGRGPDERCVVLGSGDPFYYGIGTYLRVRLGPDVFIVEPAVSSMQLAFARVVHPWHDAAIASVHGRPLAPNLLPLLGREAIGLFTEGGASPAAVAEFFLERGLDDYDAYVCEDLGAPAERVTRLDIADLPGRRFGDLNILILLRRGNSPGSDRDGPPGRRMPAPADDRFARPDAGPTLLTHADVRAVALNRFHGLPDGPVWDVGAGLGGIAVGLANLFPGTEVVAVERSPAQVEYLRINRRRFGAWNMRVVHGEAPEALRDEEAPAGVFLGGSGGRLDEILDLVRDRLRDGGVLVANFVGLENLGRALERLREWGWAPSLSQIQVSQGEPLAGLTTLAPQRPVWIVRAVKGGTSSDRGAPG
jgi:precorrin-6B C5,15-methyltransferase / cobalt-precorrin-6B C5,C15-methyltransferase